MPAKVRPSELLLAPVNLYRSLILRACQQIETVIHFPRAGHCLGQIRIGRVVAEVMSETKSRFGHLSVLEVRYKTGSLSTGSCGRASHKSQRKS